MGMSPAPKSMLPSRRSEPRLSDGWNVLKDMGSSEIVSKMRYAGKTDLMSATYEAALDWLRFYSLLELACLAQMIPKNLPQTFIDAAKEELQVGNIGSYAEAGFALAGMFQLRLHGEHSLTINNAESSRRYFGRLLRLDASTRYDKSMQAVLTLDRYSTLSRRDEEKLAGLFADQSSFMANIGQVMETDDRISLIVEGMGTFFDFCRTLHLLLEQAPENCADLASGIREYYACIFDGIAKDSSASLASTINLFLNFMSRCVGQQENADVGAERDKIEDIIHELKFRNRWPIPDEWAELLGTLLPA